MSEPPGRWLLDTSVVVDADDPAVADALPADVAVSAVTLAELALGPLVSTDARERAARQRRLQDVEANFDPLPVDAAVARSYASVAAASRASGRTSRRRFADLLVAATAHAHSVPLATRNADDFAGVEGLVDVRTV